MCISQMSENPHTGTDDGFQFLHFPRQRDAGFNHRQPDMLSNAQHGKRDTDLGIITARTAINAWFIGKQLIYPFLHHGLAITAGDRNNVSSKAVAVPCRKLLQRRPYVRHRKKIRIPASGKSLAHLADNKIPHSPRIEDRDIIMGVMVDPLQGKKKSRAWSRHGTAVHTDFCNLSIFYGRGIASPYSCNFFYKHFLLSH